MNLSEIADKYGEKVAIDIAVNQLGMIPSDARFVIAIESGKLQGDVVGDSKKKGNP